MAARSPAFIYLPGTRLPSKATKAKTKKLLAPASAQVTRVAAAAAASASASSSSSRGVRGRGRALLGLLLGLNRPGTSTSSILLLAWT